MPVGLPEQSATTNSGACTMKHIVKFAVLVFIGGTAGGLLGYASQCAGGT